MHGILAVCRRRTVAADILCEFMEVAVHTILYMRRLYPSGVFETRKKYNIPVQICQHPDVSQYVTDVINSIKPLLEDNQVDKLVVVVLSKNRNPLERFVFEIAPVTQGSTDSDKFLFRLEESLRAFLLRLSVCDAMLSPVPQDKTWSILVHTKESGAAKMEERQQLHNFPWIEADVDQLTLTDPNLIPLKATTSDIIKMQLYVEEAGHKDTG